jgi:hypothetical protein
MEDHLWMSPHKDEKIESTADATKKIATIPANSGLTSPLFRAADQPSPS